MHIDCLYGIATKRLTLQIQKITKRHKSQTHSRLFRSANESLQVNNVSNEISFSNRYRYRPMEMAVNDTVDGAQQPQPSPVEALGPYDIICGRNKLAFNNIGNRRFRVTVQLTMDRYMAATTRNETSKVIKYVADIVRENGGRFLRLSPDGKHWIELDKKHIHEKVGHALRDAAPSKRESDSTTADTFPYTRPYSSSAISHLQQDSNNILNTPLKEPTTHRRPRDTSTLSSRQFRVSTMDQWIPASRPDGVSTFDFTDPNAIQKTLGGQEEESKPPAKELELKRKNAMEPTSFSKVTPPKVHVTHRTPMDSSILSRRQMLSPSALEQWITANVSTLHSTEQATALQPHGGQDDARKLPAMPPQQQQTHQEHQVDSIKASSLSPEQSHKSIEPYMPDASGKGEYETFDHSPFGDHHDADFEW